ncbi:MAG: lactate racemase domain-containing protein [Ilumatobacteraceae bacterium]
MPRPGFVLDVDRSTPPTLFWQGEGLTLEHLPPDRSRVIYAPEPLPALNDIDGAIRHALLHPIDHDPLPSLLFPGMRLTIAFDDVSLPLPQMRRPDVRQRVIEAVLDLAAEAGVDDVELIVALALHRRMTEAELRHAVGDRIYDAFEPRRLLTQHDAEDPTALEYLGTTPQGEEVEINKRAATSDLLVYVNINLVAMDGGWKSTATGLASYRSLRHHHNPATMEASHSFMDQHRSELHKSNWRMGKVLVDSGVKVFQIETTLNNDTFPSSFEFLSRREWEWTAKDRATYLGTAKSLSLAPVRLSRKILHSIEAPHQMTSVQAGEVEAVHRVTTDHVYRQQLVEVQGQTDILTMGIPYICPYNVHSIMNPVLVMCTGLGYFFNLYRGRPLVRKGGVVIMSHPTRPDFNPVHHPSYIDFYEEVLADTTDPHVMSKQYEERYATDDWYRHLYRTGNAYHGVHPFYMWYWGAHGMQHCGRVIVIGGDPKAVRRLGFVPASTLDDALEIASDTVGRFPTITHLHTPPLMLADVK